MYQERKEDLSVFHWTKNLFSTTSYITVVDGFPETLLSVPTVAVDWESLDGRHFELGNKVRMGRRTFYIDVFAKNKTQRDEIAYKIFHELEESIPVYDYDESFTVDVPPVTQLGCLTISDEVRIDVIRIIPELVDKLYYRASVSFMAEFEAQ